MVPHRKPTHGNLNGSSAACPAQALLLVVDGDEVHDLEFLFPAGVATCTSSPTRRLRSARPMGEVVDISPFSASASSLLTSLYSTLTSRWVSSTRIREPYPERSLGMFERFSMPRSPMRFLSWAIR